MFNPWFPKNDICYEVCGTLMIIAACVVLYRVHHGSKSTFAYALMIMTILQGVAWVGNGLAFQFRKEVVYANGVVLPHISVYAFDLFNGLYFCMAL